MKKKLLSLLLTVAMVISMATPVMADTEQQPVQRKINYLCVGDSIPAGFGLDQSLYDEATMQFAGNFPSNSKFEVEELKSFGYNLNKSFAQETGGQGDYSLNATCTGMRLEDLTLALGLTNEPDSYNESVPLEGEELEWANQMRQYYLENKDETIEMFRMMSEMWGMAMDIPEGDEEYSEWVKQMVPISKDGFFYRWLPDITANVDKIKNAIKNADVITVTYGSNELYGYMTQALFANMDFMYQDPSDRPISGISGEQLFMLQQLLSSAKMASTLLEIENESIRDFAKSWNALIEYVEAVNPNATVVFTGLYMPSDAVTGMIGQMGQMGGISGLSMLPTDLIPRIGQVFVDAINNYVESGSRTIQINNIKALFDIKNYENTEDILKAIGNVRINLLPRTKYTAKEDKQILFVNTDVVVKENLLNEVEGDMIHPTEEGHAVIAGLIKNALSANEDCLHNVYKLVNKKASTGLEEGYTGDKCCAVCGKVLEEGKAIPKLKTTVKTSTLPCKVKQTFNAGSNLNIAKDDKVVKVATSNKKYASVSGTTVKGLKKGKTATITVTMKSGAKVTYKVKVQSSAVKAKSIKLSSASKLTLKKGSKSQIKATKSAPITCKYGLKYSSSKKSVATVSSKGVITAKKKGTAKIYVKCTGAKTKTIKVTVK